MISRFVRWRFKFLALLISLPASAVMADGADTCRILDPFFAMGESVLENLQTERSARIPLESGTQARIAQLLAIAVEAEPEAISEGWDSVRGWEPTKRILEWYSTHEFRADRARELLALFISTNPERYTTAGKIATIPQEEWIAKEYKLRCPSA